MIERQPVIDSNMLENRSGNSYISQEEPARERGRETGFGQSQSECRRGRNRCAVGFSGRCVKTRGNIKRDDKGTRMICPFDKCRSFSRLRAKRKMGSNSRALKEFPE